MEVYYWIIIIENSHSVVLGTHLMFYDRHVSILVFQSCVSKYMLFLGLGMC